MKKIVLLALMMLPGVILGQVNDLTGYNEFSEEMIENYRQLPAADQHLALMLLKSVQYDNKGGYWVYANDTIRNPEVMALRIKEQNKVTEICNIPFGSSYEKSKKILRKEYGNSNAYTSTKDCLVYNNKIFGGILFTDMLFMFQHDEQKSYLNKAVLNKDAKTKYEAVQLKKSIDDQLSSKYQIYQIFDDDMVYFSMGGIPPVPGDGVYGGYAIKVDVLELDNPTESGCLYSVRIVFGPYDFAEEY